MTDNSQETLDDQPGTQANADRRAGFGEIFGRVFLVLLAICLLGWFLLPLLVAVVGVIIGFLGVLLGLFFSLGWIFAFTLPIILVAAVITLVIMVARRLVKGPAA